MYKTYLRLKNVGLTKRYYHYSEINGLAWAYRKLFCLSVINPIKFYSDHGRDYLLDFDEHEVTHEARLHLMWWKTRLNVFKEKYPHLANRVVHCPNPIAALIASNHDCVRSILKPRRKPLLYFFPHSNENISYRTDLKENLTRIQNLKKQYGGIEVCLHYVDVKNGLGEFLTQNEINWFSNGHNEYYSFGKKMITNFSEYEYACSEFPGTELFYCHLLGVKYFIKGERGTFIPKDETPRAFRDQSENAIYNIENALFSEANLGGSQSKKSELVDDIMGLGAMSKLPELRSKIHMDLSWIK